MLAKDFAAIFFIVLFGGLFIFICIISAIKAVRDRRKIKKFIKAKEEALRAVRLKRQAYINMGQIDESPKHVVSDKDKENVSFQYKETESQKSNNGKSPCGPTSIITAGHRQSTKRHQQILTMREIHHKIPYIQSTHRYVILLPWKVLQMASWSPLRTATDLQYKTTIRVRCRTIYNDPLRGVCLVLLQEVQTWRYRKITSTRQKRYVVTHIKWRAENRILKRPRRNLQSQTSL